MDGATVPQNHRSSRGFHEYGRLLLDQCLDVFSILIQRHKVLVARTVGHKSRKIQMRSRTSDEATSTGVGIKEVEDALDAAAAITERRVALIHMEPNVLGPGLAANVGMAPIRKNTGGIEACDKVVSVVESLKHGLARDT